MADEIGENVVLLLPRVLLEGGASEGYLSSGGLDLATIELLVEWVLVEREGVLLMIMLPIGGRPSLKGTIFEQALGASIVAFLADLDLVDLEAKPFFAGGGRFTSFTSFSQLGGNSLHIRTTPLPPSTTQIWWAYFAS